jgi:predicted RNA-binding Zn-ribbon protein involved in translation (DUF1610 family)
MQPLFPSKPPEKCEEKDMTSVQDVITCPQCGYEQVDYVYNCRTSEDTTSCRRCGYHECWDAQYDEDNTFSGWIHRIERGAGALWYQGIGQVGMCGHFLNKGKEVADAEKWLREALDKGQVDPDVSYLTRWNREANQVEFVIGEFYDWPEADGDESKSEVAAPGPSLQPPQPDTPSAVATPTDLSDFIDDEF